MKYMIFKINYGVDLSYLAYVSRAAYAKKIVDTENFFCRMNGKEESFAYAEITDAVAAKLDNGFVDTLLEDVFNEPASVFVGKKGGKYYIERTARNDDDIIVPIRYIDGEIIDTREDFILKYQYEKENKETH